MTYTIRVFFTLASVAMIAASQVLAQQPATPTPAPPAAPGGAQGRGNITTFPAQQRPPGDPAVVERGKRIYGISCRAVTAWTSAAATSAGRTCSDRRHAERRHGELLLPIFVAVAPAAGMPADRNAGRRCHRGGDLHPQRARHRTGAGRASAGPPVV